MKNIENEENVKRRIQGKSNNNNIPLWFYLLHKKLYFACSLYHHILFTTFMRFRVFELQ